MLSNVRKATILFKLAQFKTARLVFKGGSLRTLIASTDEEMARGLSGLDSLPSNTGMLFVMPSVGPVHFWMRDTHIPLDIAFLDANMRVLSIQTMASETGSARHEGPVRYAVETNAGWFKKNGVVPGAIMEGINV